MVSAKKLSDVDCTQDFELPESFRPSEATSQLKIQKQSIDHAIEKAKIEVGERKSEESTQVFNLRQQQMLAKLKQLEQKKQQTEKELNQILSQKNSSIHDELKKVTTLLLTETKKIAPLEKEIESGMSKISNLRNEMQFFFDSAIEEKKKSSSVIEDQTREIQSLGNLVKTTTLMLEKNYRLMSNEIEDLSLKKVELIEQITKVKEDLVSKESLLFVLDQKKEELKKIEMIISSYKEQLPEVRENEVRYLTLKEDYSDLKKKHQELEIQVLNCEQERAEVINGHNRLECMMKYVEENLSLRRETLLSIEKDILDGKKRFEFLKNEEFDIERQIRQSQKELLHLKIEISEIEGRKSAMMAFQEESFQLYHEKKDYYQRELNLLEDSHNMRCSKLESDFENKKLNWDEEFRVFCLAKENELNQELKSIEQDDLDLVRKRKKEFTNKVLMIVKEQSERTTFTSLDQKTQEVKSQLDLIFEQLFGKTSRWKIW